MAFTRFHDDINRIEKTNLETTAINNYTFNVPGNINVKNIYFSDPHIRMQKTGTHLCRNLLNVENELKNLHIPLGRDDVKIHRYDLNSSYKTKVSIHDINKTITNETRASHPAWTFREKSQFRPDYLFLNPQENLKLHFEHNVDTNILEKDYYNLKTYKKI